MNVWLRSLFTIVWIGGSAPLSAQSVTGPGFDSDARVYLCAGGTSLQVLYLNLRGGESFAVVQRDGRLGLLRSGPTGSGANYLPVDEQFGYRWHTKGNVGTLWRLAADPTARETLVLGDCLSTPLPSR